MRKRSVWVVEYKSMKTWNVHSEVTAYSTAQKAQDIADYRTRQYPGTEYRVTRYDAVERRPRGKRA